jgi:hypothetical protein
VSINATGKRALANAIDYAGAHRAGADDTDAPDLPFTNILG